MREILFKAKQTDTGEWVEGDLQRARNLETAYINGFHYYYNSKGLQKEPFICSLSSETICQYTGLRDRTGKRIWENDIVHFKTNGLKGTGVVFWEKEAASFRIKDIKKGKREYINLMKILYIGQMVIYLIILN